MTITETHEPDEPMNWPDGHVSVTRAPKTSNSTDRLKLADVSVSITGPEDDECILLSLSAQRHYLHSTTARALSDKLVAHDGHAVEIVVHAVTHTAGQNAARALRQQLQRRLAEWNAINAGSAGWHQV